MLAKPDFFIYTIYNMTTIESMLVQHGVLKAGNYRITGAAVSNSLAIYDGKGNLTHRVERSAIGNDLVVVDVVRNRVVHRLKVTSTLTAA